MRRERAEKVVAYSRKIGAARSPDSSPAPELEEVDALAHRIAVIDRGRVVAEGTPADLKARVGAGTVRIRLADPSQQAAAAAALAGLTGTSVGTIGDPLVLTIGTDGWGQLPKLGPCRLAPVDASSALRLGERALLASARGGDAAAFDQLVAGCRGELIDQSARGTDPV